MEYIKKPLKIEEKSFEIIEKEMGNKLDCFTQHQLPIVKRVVHTTADFEYAELIEFSPDAVKIAQKSLIEGKSIYCDTSMIMAGINKRKTSKLGINLLNYVHDDDVRKKAKEKVTTRYMEGIEKAAKDDRIGIFAVGNAPTALFKLKELIDSGLRKPDLIIGVPVGFVGAAESKEILRKMDVPYITVIGRKGGSTVAAAIVNAVLKMI
jgi:precorrin-8X/cobalt-precorrin-8 methylmutase